MDYRTLFNRSTRITVTLTLINLSACTAWKATQAPLPDLVGEYVRVTTSDGQRLAGNLSDADSLGSAVLRRSSREKEGVMVDTTAISLVEKRAMHAGKTTGLVLLALSAVGLVLWQIHLVFSDPDY